MNSTIAPMSSRPAAACAASATPVPSSSVALRIAAEHDRRAEEEHERPEHGVPVHRPDDTPG